jgi:ETC complex I subunit conserved region
MLRARLYKPSKTSTQSGKEKTKIWFLDFLLSPTFFKDKVTGWTGSTNTLSQVKLKIKLIPAASSGVF